MRIELLGPAVIALALILVPASANLVELLGDWHNIDSRTRGLVRIVIAEAGGAITVHPWGACHPDPCDWGTVKATLYAPDIDTALPAGAQYLLAEFTTSFSTTMLIISPAAGSKGQLSVISMGRFTDWRRHSKSNHALTELFAR